MAKGSGLLWLLGGAGALAAVMLSTKKASAASEGSPAAPGASGALGFAPGASEGSAPTAASPSAASPAAAAPASPVEDLSEFGPDPILPVGFPQYTGRITAKSQPKDWPGQWANLGSFGANGGAHKGVDFSTEAGTPLLAVGTGRVTNVTKEGDPANKNTLGGTTATIEFEYNGRKYSAYYAHMKDIYVKRGDLVKIGQQIGTVGNTGNARTTGPHCHFELKIDGAYVDPLKNLKPVSA